MLLGVVLKQNLLFRPSEDELEDGKSPNMCDDIVAGKACRDAPILPPIPNLSPRVNYSS